ncbi:MAG TPA: SRPBCC family protein [Ferruginibacter sp.]|nr:SRPBCC family protein [Ferruginibacter sp.]
MKNNITATASIAIDTYPVKVWEALTTPSIIKQYFFGTDVSSDWKVGGQIFFRGEWQGKKYEDKGTIVSIIPNKLFKYNYWSSMSGIEDKPENYVLITYDLHATEGGTRLIITQDNVPDEKMKEHSEQNWMKVLTDLKALLEKHPVNSL